MSEMAKEIFEQIEKDNDCELSWAFYTNYELDNIESMHEFIEENDLEAFVSDDDGTLVFLEHPDYEFEVALTSHGLGDFYSHGIYAQHSCKDLNA